MKKITVYCEADLLSKKLQNVSYELISKAYELINSLPDAICESDFILEAVVLADCIDPESIKKAFSAGANRFVLIKDKTLETFCHTVFSKAFVDYYKNNPSDVIIFPATPRGRMCAPRITAMLDCGLVADCTGLDFIIRDNKLSFAPTRPTFGAELMATILSKSSPQCATVRPGTFEALFNQDENGEYVEFCPPSYSESRIKLVKAIIDTASKGSDFSDANIILCAGWGLVEKKEHEYFSKLEQIARIVGAKVGATRKVVDSGFMPQSSQIGQTGAVVCPELYIAFGVSGAIQHIMGMKNSKTIVAINTDSNAEIFNYADYKVVTDAKNIIDELYDKLCLRTI